MYTIETRRSSGGQAKNQIREEDYMSPKTLAIFTGGVVAATACAVVFSMNPVEARAQQRSFAPIRCATVQPGVDEMQSIEEFVSRYGSTLDGTVTIPVVVHVIRTNTGGGDVSDSRINSQIAVLNGAFDG